jgi:dihydroorotase
MEKVLDLLLIHADVDGARINVGIEDGKIAYLGKDRPSAHEKINLHGKVLLPGMIDPHVHVRDMGMEYKETWETGSRAALAGGVTTIIDMPNTKPPLISIEAYDQKNQAAKKSYVNYSFHAGTDEHSLYQLGKLFEDRKRAVAGLKLFLAETSSNEVTVQKDFLTDAMSLARQYNKVVLFHAELEKCVIQNSHKYSDEKYDDIIYHSTIRNIQCELDALKLIIELSAKTNTPSYICHLTSAAGYDLVAQAQKNGVPLYMELTPHHTFLSEDAVFLFGNIAKVNPPLRNEKERLYLYNRLINGELSCVGSDHAPHFKDEKMMRYSKAPSGFPGLETSYHLLIDQAIRGHMNFNTVKKIACENPAEIFSIPKRGKIEAGYYADLAVVDQEAEWKVDPDIFESKAKYSPFLGKNLKGKVCITIVNGVASYIDKEFTQSVHGKDIYSE